jgi:hypothetical protein
VTPEQAKLVGDLLGALRAAHGGLRLPKLAVVSRARAVLRLADAKPQGLTEADQQVLDDLHGFTKWGELVYPVSRIEPAVFAARRRAKRSRSGLLRADWGD